MIKVRCPVVVEGKYDRIRLSSLIDGVVLETGGFRIWRDREKLAALRHLSRTTGRIIMTDPDGAGFRIRNFLKGALGPEARLIQVYVPAVSGRERRKSAPSAEGLLGVEGLDEETLRAALLRAGVAADRVESRADLTRADLYDAGLIGHPDSAERRRLLLRELSLPPRCSSSTLLSLCNTLLTREEFFSVLKKLGLT